MTIWTSVDKEMPQPFIMVQVRGGDSQGEWTSHAWWQPYKGKSPGNPRKHGRWMQNIDGAITIFASYGDVDHWRPMPQPSRESI